MEERKNLKGFTLIELLVVIAIVGIIAAVGAPKILAQIEKAEYAHAVQDVKSYFKEAKMYRISNGEYPSTWTEIGYSSPPVDPWGNEYVLNNHDDISPGARRSDGPTIPINSQLDIFSSGPNGHWDPNILAAQSKDDVILAMDGSFVGKAEDF